MRRSPVIEDVSSCNLCIGCGTCAAICPRQRLSIGWNMDGCYQVKEDDSKCPENCNACIRVCPFSSDNPDEDDLARMQYGSTRGVKHREELGYYQNAYVGNSSKGKQRADGASGGMATWFLSELLSKGTVDYVICVTPHHGPKPLFKFTVCESVEQIEMAAKSAYYPVEMSEVIRRLLSVEGRYAVITLPCFAKSLRLAAMQIPKINKRLVCIAGLACGHGANANFAEYVASVAGAEPDQMSSVMFRVKASDRPADDVGTECVWKLDQKTHSKRVFWSEGLSKAWSGCWFVPNPCFYCDDVFAETADIAFMDAWLPRYTSDPRGTSIVLTRSRMAEEMIQEGIRSFDLQLSACSADDVVRSQYSAIRFKREGLGHRLWLSKRHGIHVPMKRWPVRKAAGMFAGLQWSSQMSAAGSCHEAWSDRLSLGEFQGNMLRLTRIARYAAKISKLFRLKGHGIEMLKRIVFKA